MSIPPHTALKRASTVQRAETPVQRMDPAYRLHSALVRTNGSDLDPLLGGEVKVNIALSHVSFKSQGLAELRSSLDYQDRLGVLEDEDMLAWGTEERKALYCSAVEESKHLAFLLSVELLSTLEDARGRKL